MMTIRAAARDIRAGRLTPVDLVEQCLERIAAVEPRVKAWVVVDADGAREQARRLTDELRRGTDRGPLHGIPLGIKDIIDVFDLPTACGSRLWKDSVARQDAPVVKSLRAAGAVILGKTVTTQYASFDPPVTRNPWDLSRTPGGSSSGSAAAVAAGMCLGALGTQTGGSITRPAAYCGVASFKPRYNAFSTKGILPLAESMDHVGPMARDVTDLALLATGMGPCLDLLAPGYGLPPRLEQAGGPFVADADPPMRDHVTAVREDWRKGGAGGAVFVPPPEFAEVPERHRAVMAVEAAAYHEERFRRHPEDYDPCITRLIEEGLACSAPLYKRHKQHQRELKQWMEWTLGEYRCVLLTPATRGPAPDAATTGDPLFNSPWSYLGFPVLSFPTGRGVDGLPLAVQFVGLPYKEVELFQAALWAERALGFDVGSPPC